MIVGIIVARNEEASIGETIVSILKQTVPIKLIVVDDGSIDDTFKIASELGCEVVSLPNHAESYVGQPELAMRWNAGLHYAKQYKPDYILMMGGDHVLPPTYIEDLLERMDNNIVVASGRLEGEPYASGIPQGSGRLIRADFWEKASSLQFPVEYGWESWQIYKALQMGYYTACFYDVVSKSRPISLNSRKASKLGKGMWCLGYNWKLAIARCMVTFFHSPESGWNMFVGWLFHKGCKKLDVANFVNRLQNEIFWKRVKTFIMRGGRK